MENNRKKYGQIAALAGIGLNLVLFGIKLPAGLITGSVAITSDAFNNLSDMGSSVVALLSACLAAKKPDKDHPYGHGRIEYLSSLVIAAFILMVAVELFKSSLDKVLHPGEVTLSIITAVLLVLSVGVKLFMFVFNRRIGKKINSKVQLATAQDSLNDSIITASVLICTIIGTRVSFPVDGVAGIAISLLVLKSAIDIGKDTVSVLLGSTPDPETVQDLRSRIESSPVILGTHDLVLHDYGPGRVMASAHAEVSAHQDVMTAHEAIDEIEKKVLEETGIELVLHMDPIDTDNEILQKVNNALAAHLATLPVKVSFHDLRMTNGTDRINLIFDIVVPPEASDASIKEWKNGIVTMLKAIDPRFVAVIQVDRSYL